MKEYPLVSVGIPCYNHEKYVKEAIESVINQDYKDIELIIINDGSRDKTNEVIQKLIEKCNKRFVRFEYRNRENKGLSATLNEMVEWSRGEYFTAIASDDVMLKNKISLLVEKFELLDESYAVIFGNAIFIDDNSKELYLDNKTGQPTSKENGFNLFLDYYTINRDFDYRDKNSFGSYKTLLAGNYLPAMSYIIKLDKIKEVGGWTNGNTIEDWEMWLKLSKKYKFAYVDKPVALYRWHNNNSCKLMKKKLIFDSISLLEREEQFALSSKLDKVYFCSYFNHLSQLWFYLKKIFIYKILKSSTNYKFVLCAFGKVTSRLVKLIKRWSMKKGQQS